MSARCINLLLMYLTHAVALSATWKVMKPHIHQLVVSCIFPMTCFDDEDQMLWDEDPHEYIRKVSTALDCSASASARDKVSFVRAAVCWP